MAGTQVRVPARPLRRKRTLPKRLDVESEVVLVEATDWSTRETVAHPAARPAWGNNRIMTDQARATTARRNGLFARALKKTSIVRTFTWPGLLLHSLLNGN